MFGLKNTGFRTHLRPSDWFFSDLFDNFYEGNLRKMSGIKTVSEDNKLIFKVPVPGFTKDNLTVDIKDGIVSINGEIDDQKFGYEKIQTAFNCPNEYVSVDAKIENGCLYLTFELKNSSISTRIAIE